MDHQEKITGTLDRVVFSNADTGFCVARVKEQGTDRIVTVVGLLAEVVPGEELVLVGQWVTSPQYGQQFQVSESVRQVPRSAQGIELYLASNLVSGIGPKLAEKIVARFGNETLDIIEQTPDRLAEIPGLGRKRIDRLVESMASQRGIQDVVVFLRSHGIGQGVALKVYRHYRDRTLPVLRTNPYRLVRDVAGIGFATADKIATSLGLERETPARIQAGIDHVLAEAAAGGHCFLPVRTLLGAAERLLDVPGEKVLATLREMAQTRRVIAEETGDSGSESADGLPGPLGSEGARVYQPHLHRAEGFIASRIAALAATKPVFGRDRLTVLLDQVEKRLSLAYHPRQREAILQLARGNVLVITGGPGTGKTTLIRGLMEVLRAAGLTFSLAAPTGRAAKRIEEATGEPARTIHRLLHFQPRDGSFAFNDETPLPVGAIIIDEASMIDVPLATHVLEALVPGTILILVGDVDQLPSIGPGAVLRDLIACGRPESDRVSTPITAGDQPKISRSDSGLVRPGDLPVVRLTHVFRQAQKSLLVANAHRINRGQIPSITGSHAGTVEDFYFIERTDPASIVSTVLEVVTERIPRRFGLNPVRDVQVLVPMHRGEIGVENLNRLLRERLSTRRESHEGAGPQILEGDVHGPCIRGPDTRGPDKPVEDSPEPPSHRGRPAWAIGDKVMQCVNDYDREVFNGDVGLVRSVTPGHEEIVVEFDGRQVPYRSADFDKLQLAYAVSVHKAQGSEYPAVVIVLHTQHWILLQRNLLYTALTRARRLAVLIGSKPALMRAVSNDRPVSRHTRLADRLREELARVPREGA